MMGMLEQIGLPSADSSGTLRINHRIDRREENGAVYLSCGGRDFVVCKVKDGNPVVQIVDADVGVVFERDIRLLCWSY